MTRSVSRCCGLKKPKTIPRWAMSLRARYTKNPDKSTRPLTHPFAHSLSLRAPLRSFICSLAHFAHSLARETVNDWMAIYSVFCSILDQSEWPPSTFARGNSAAKADVESRLYHQRGVSSSSCRFARPTRRRFPLPRFLHQNASLGLVLGSFSTIFCLKTPTWQLIITQLIADFWDLLVHEYTKAMTHWHNNGLFKNKYRGVLQMRLLHYHSFYH